MKEQKIKNASIGILSMMAAERAEVFLPYTFLEENLRLEVMADVMGLYCERKGLTDPDEPLEKAVEWFIEDLLSLCKRTGLTDGTVTGFQEVVERALWCTERDWK